MAAVTPELEINVAGMKVEYDSDEIGATDEGSVIRFIQEDEDVVTDEGGSVDGVVTDVKVEVDIVSKNWNLTMFSKVLGSRVSVTGSNPDEVLTFGKANNTEIGLLHSDLAKALHLTPVSGAASPLYQFDKAVFVGTFEFRQSARKPAAPGYKFRCYKNDSGEFGKVGKIT